LFVKKHLAFYQFFFELPRLHFNLFRLRSTQVAQGKSGLSVIHPITLRKSHHTVWWNLRRVCIKNGSRTSLYNLCVALDT